jgi:uncharacterized protein
MSKIGRRGFLKAAAGTALASGLAGFPGGGIRPSRAEAVQDAIPRRALGRTGYQATILSLGGGSALAQPDNREEAVEIIGRALDLGINYIDTAPAYGNGTSETYVGEALGGRRDQVFLATKTRERRAQPIRAGAFEESCQRLQTEEIDLYFLHGVHDREHLATVMDRDGGAIRAFEHYREAGRIRYLGISSHSSETLITAMDEYDFDCVFVTLNPAGISMEDPENIEAMLAKAAGKNVGVIAMKIVGGTGGGILSRGITMQEALRYTLSFPVCTANIGISRMDQLEENVRLAKAFVPYDEKQRAELVRRASG